MNALASAQLALKVGLPSVGLRLSRAPTVSEMFRQLQTVQRGSGAMFGDLEKSSRARRGQRSPGVVFAKGRWQKERDELRKERQDAPAGAGPSKPAGFGKPKAPPPRPPKLLDILVYPDPRLRAENKPVTVFDAELQQLAKDMFHTMYRTDGIGLAAPQVGANIRMMVFNEEGVEGKGRELVLLNPRIVKFSEELDFFEEGCLSFPRIYADVKRPVACVVEFEDLSGGTRSLELSGLEARVFQHEFDHLQGVLFHDRMAAPALATVADKLRALEADGVKKGWAVAPPPPSAVPY